MSAEDPDELEGARAADFILERLRLVRVIQGRWESEYVDPLTGEMWLKDYPNSECHGGGSPRLRKIPTRGLKNTSVWRPPAADGTLPSPLTCRCADLHPAEEAVPTRAAFTANFELIESIPRQWAKLMRCRVCGQYWKDEGGGEAGRHTNHAFKISDPARWLEFNAEPARVELLIRKQGGLSRKRCLQAGCTEMALADVVFCIRHAGSDYVL